MKYEKQINDLYTVTTESRTVSNVAFVCLFGSQLHGTNGPQSDMDYKAVYLEDIDSIILGKDKENHVSSSGGPGKNVTGDVDIEFIELRKFLKDAVKGQTYALEMLHVPPSHTEITTPVYLDIQKNKGKLITNNAKPFIGYCVGQAKKYGLKGERLQDTEDALDYLKKQNPLHKLSKVSKDLPLGPHVFFLQKELRSQNKMADLLEINGKQFNLEVKVKAVIPVVEGLISEYGARAQKAREGVDWKAVGHAYRCIFELEELLTTGNITFPLKDAPFLKQVKQGEIPYDTIQEELPVLIEKVEAIKTDLPDKADLLFWEDWTLQTYKGHVR